MKIEYITTRPLENSKGEIKGKIRIVKLMGEEEATVELTCPQCGFSEKRKEAWQEPFVVGTGIKKKFTVKCGKCGLQIKLLKLKKEKKKR